MHTIFECGSMCKDFDNNFKLANFTASQEMLVWLKWKFKSHQKTNSLPFGRQRTIWALNCTEFIHPYTVYIPYRKRNLIFKPLACNSTHSVLCVPLPLINITCLHTFLTLPYHTIPYLTSTWWIHIYFEWQRQSLNFSFSSLSVYFFFVDAQTF